MPHTRFAPSPTGSLHIGGVRTALFSMLAAQGGTFSVRLEDTDQRRSSDTASHGILDDLRWLGLLPDGPVIKQSDRLDVYDRHIDMLIDSDHAYADGSVVRFRSPKTSISVNDIVLGDVTAVQDEDFVIRKADGYPTYHFAVVVDDHDMGVDLIVRGQEHLLNTHKHIALYQAFGWSVPSYGHLPMIFNPSGGKMSKRDKAKTVRKYLRDRGIDASVLLIDGIQDFLRGDIDDVGVATAIAEAYGIPLPLIDVSDFRAAGYTPQAILNYVALLGWSPPGGLTNDVFDLDALTTMFNLSDVGTSAARFDPVKMTWINGQWLARASVDDYRAWAVTQGAVDCSAVWHLYKSRVQTYAQVAKDAAWCLSPPTTYDRPKNLDTTHLPIVCDMLRTVDWTPEAIHNGLLVTADAVGVKIGVLATAVRVAVTGKNVSPPIGDTLACLTRDDVIARIGRLS